MIGRIGFALAAAALSAGLTGPAQAQDYSAPLYPGPAPGSEHWQWEAVTVETPAGKSRYNVREPQVSVYLPAPANATGAAVVLLPGGGLRVLGLDHDLESQIARFTAEGIAVILLEYRTLQLSPDEIARASAPRPAGAAPPRFPRMEIRNANANPASGNPALDEVLRLAVKDGQEALKLARARAAEWRIDPARVGMVGISAGGGVAFGTMLAGVPGQTPDFIVSIFGPALQDVTVPAEAPPLFLVTETDHGPVTDGLVALFQMWKDHGKRAELHIYDVPVFSMRVDLWGDRLFTWMRERGFVPSPKP